MKLHELRPAKGATKKEKRLGRGEASGHGGTSTKGNKGHQSRSGFKNRRAHEGGQMPIQRRVPKRGFTNNNRVEYKVFNVGQIEQLVAKYAFDAITPEVLFVNGLARRTDLIKVLGNGDISVKVTVVAHAFSASASEKIAAAGGSISKL